MFEKEVDYRLAKWLLLNMEKDGVISPEELKLTLDKIAEYYVPPFRNLRLLRKRQRQR